jgi:hypothetical protein
LKSKHTHERKAYRCLELLVVRLKLLICCNGRYLMPSSRCSFIWFRDKIVNLDGVFNRFIISKIVPMDSLQKEKPLQFTRIASKLQMIPFAYFPQVIFWVKSRRNFFWRTFSDGTIFENLILDKVSIFNETFLNFIQLKKAQNLIKWKVVLLMTSFSC